MGSLAIVAAYEAGDKVVRGMAQFDMTVSLSYTQSQLL